MDSKTVTGSIVDKLPAQLVEGCVMLSVVMLCVGINASVLLFIYLAFTKPSAAAIVIPLLFGPIGTLVVQHARQLGQRAGSQLGSNQTIGGPQPTSSITDSVKQLESNR
jgi:hypothetical protein